MRRKCVLALVVTSAISHLALADEPKQSVAKARSSAAVRLSDAQLDKVYAGASTFLILNNPGNDDALKVSNNHFGCLNLCGAPTDRGASGFHVAVTPSGNQIVHCIGGGSGCF